MKERNVNFEVGIHNTHILWAKTESFLLYGIKIETILW